MADKRDTKDQDSDVLSTVRTALGKGAGIELTAAMKFAALKSQNIVSKPLMTIKKETMPTP